MRCRPMTRVAIGLFVLALVGGTRASAELLRAEALPPEEIASRLAIVDPGEPQPLPGGGCGDPPYLRWEDFAGKEGVDGDDEGLSVVAHSDGFVYMAGTTESWGSGQTDALLLKWPEEGGPYAVKRRFFRTATAWSSDSRPGFHLQRRGGRDLVRGRFAEGEYRLELGDGEARFAGPGFELTFDPVTLHQDFPNLDLVGRHGYNRQGLSDTFAIGLLLRGRSGGEEVYRATTITIQGERVYVQEGEGAPAMKVYLPVVLKGG